MRRIGLWVIYQKPRTTVTGEQSEQFFCLIDVPAITAFNQVCVTDITYIFLQKGFLYLVKSKDLFPRNILGWKLSNTLT